MVRVKYLILIPLIIATGLRGQVTQMDKMLEGELRMTFPSIYFKNNSIDYAEMPYPADSCFKFMAANIKDINCFVIWRDKSESEELLKSRIKKLKSDLNRFTSEKIDIQSMGTLQRLSEQTIQKGIGKDQIQFLLSLNSMFDICRTRMGSDKSGSKLTGKSASKSHVERPSIFCPSCWRHGFHIKLRRQLKVARRNSRPKE